MIKNEKGLGETWKWARGRDFRTSHQDGDHQRAATMAPNRQNDKGDHVCAHTIPELTGQAHECSDHSHKNPRAQAPLNKK